VGAAEMQGFWGMLDITDFNDRFQPAWPPIGWLKKSKSSPALWYLNHVIQV
jgi:hypothetical protein